MNKREFRNKLVKKQVSKTIELVEVVEANEENKTFVYCIFDVIDFAGTYLIDIYDSQEKADNFLDSLTQEDFEHYTKIVIIKKEVL
jgi:hypothetical protein